MTPKCNDCPFCGDGNSVEVISRYPRSGFEVLCDNCGATGPVKYSETEAALAWNERVPA